MSDHFRLLRDLSAVREIVTLLMLLTQSIFLRDGVDENVSSSLHADFI